MPLSTRQIALAAGTALAILLFSTYLYTQQANDPFAPCRSSVVSTGPGTIGGDFTLTDENGDRVTNGDVLTKPSLVYFGYTFCPDVCPTDVARNAAAVDVLEEMGHEVTPVMISIDPERDTPEVLKEWTDFIHPRLIGLTGSEEEIKATAQAFKTYFKLPEDRTDPYYTVDHMTQTYLMLPGHGFVEFYNRETSAENLAANAACFIEAAD